MTVPAGARKLGPGLYELGDELHIDAREMCIANGYEPTDENQTRIAAAAAHLADEGMLADGGEFVITLDGEAQHGP